MLHDSLCPMTPPDFIAECVRRAVDRRRRGGGRPAGHRHRQGRCTATPSARPSTGRRWPAWSRPSWCRPTGWTARPHLLADPGVDLAALVEALRADGPRRAPSRRRPRRMRVSGPDDVRVLEALTRPGRDEPSRPTSRSSGKVILRLAGPDGTAAIVTSAYRSTHEAVSVPVNPSALGRPVGRQQVGARGTPAASARPPGGASATGAPSRRTTPSTGTTGIAPAVLAGRGQGPLEEVARRPAGGPRRARPRR